jgi:hypothetical protein
MIFIVKPPEFATDSAGKVAGNSFEEPGLPLGSGGSIGLHTNGLRVARIAGQSTADENHRRTASNRRKSRRTSPLKVGLHRFQGKTGFGVTGLSGLTNDSHWNRTSGHSSPPRPAGTTPDPLEIAQLDGRIPVLATVQRGSGPLGSGFSSLSPDLWLSLSRSLGLISLSPSLSLSLSLSFSVSLLSQSLDVTLSLGGSGEKKNRRGRKNEEESNKEENNLLLNLFIYLFIFQLVK